MGLYDRDYMREKAQKLARARELLERSYEKPKRRIRIGAGLVGAGWLVILGLLALLFQYVLDMWNNPNQNPALTATAEGMQEVVLKRNRQGHYVVTGRINHQEVVFMLDTGATIVVVPETLAKDLGLVRGTPHTSKTASGVITGYRTMLDSVDIGGIVLRNIRASINPFAPDPQVLLGMSALSRLEFAQQGDILMLRKSYAE
ncbi:aspartyl protease-like protein (plasmid) [Nitrosococcus halophilus Nc 4]|uniref:Aspartyl protease-like protein n=1 Tax=Nitrosococcus halophilus (strain Nc4) TaxID=472759 RepID=D5C5F2_NITHN|nr:TIGR02281 family clan AA aspartic protease [Nitrosococcus halophilus]ADE17006.1 aspartyl protease-like protein [Nitrosococcus halophilus Nc 4]